MGKFNDKSLYRIERALYVGDLDPVTQPFTYEQAGKHNGRRDQMRAVADRVLRACGGLPIQDNILESSIIRHHVVVVNNENS